MKKILTTLAILSFTIVTGQNPFTQKSDNLKIKEEAKELAKEYDQQLGMTEDQLLQFEIKVEEYMINEKKIRDSNLNIKEKIKALKINLNKETSAMSNILTRIQYDLYKKIKPQYQSIDSVVVGEVKNVKN
ncbi:hypothetical protein [Aquimarina spongiae]|uniref:Uncharacterized protein n=1 Tax=Aquimarina spongiae TaxID=570521 RepID=A0A1M6GQ16_9FLAO|nr:hypothetical protein [Aquimarina spongiae]SHJ11960.1 hypothetical protein SAMN04488508_105388 [Aquimarina spongiae]